MLDLAEMEQAQQKLLLVKRMEPAAREGTAAAERATLAEPEEATRQVETVRAASGVITIPILLTAEGAKEEPAAMARLDVSFCTTGNHAIHRAALWWIRTTNT